MTRSMNEQYFNRPENLKYGKGDKKVAPAKAVSKKKSGGSLKPVPADKEKSLGKLPTPVRNKMGYQKDGGKMKAKSGAKMGKCKYGCK